MSERSVDQTPQWPALPWVGSCPDLHLFRPPPAGVGNTQVQSASAKYYDVSREELSDMKSFPDTMFGIYFEGVN